MSPISSARCAPIFSAAANIWRALPFPIRRGNRCVPPQPVINPSAAPRCPNTALGAAIRRWQARARSNPPPMQLPSMAAVAPAGKAATACINFWPKAENSYASGPVNFAISFKSAPAEKFCSPEITSGRSGADDDSFRISSVSAIIFLRVRRFMPSSETRLRRKTLFPRVIVNSVSST